MPCLFLLLILEVLSDELVSVGSLTLMGDPKRKAYLPWSQRSRVCEMSSSLQKCALRPFVSKLTIVLVYTSSYLPVFGPFSALASQVIA